MEKIKATIFAGLFQVCYTNVFACSGEDAGELIHFNSNASTWLFGLSVLNVFVIFLVAIKMNKIGKLKIHPWSSFILIIFHPRIWLNATFGDCGYQLFNFSIAATILLLLTLGLMYRNFKILLTKSRTH